MGNLSPLVMLWKTDEPRCGAGTPACRVDNRVDAFLLALLPTPPAVRDWRGCDTLAARGFSGGSEKRRDESRRGRHECPRHLLGSHTFHDIRRSETRLDAFRTGPKHGRAKASHSIQSPLSVWETDRREKRRDESRRGRHECPRHVLGSHTFQDIGSSESSAV